MTANVESILTALVSVAHTPAQAEHAAREVLRQHAHQLAEQQREFAERTLRVFSQEEQASVLAAADLIDPEVQS